MNPEAQPDEQTYTIIINACRVAKELETEANLKDQKSLLQKELLARKVFTKDKESS
jgi:hypothetical protein